MTEPCGTPEKIGAGSDGTPLTRTVCVLEERKDPSHLSNCPCIPRRESFFEHDGMINLIERLGEVEIICINVQRESQIRGCQQFHHSELVAHLHMNAQFEINFESKS